MNSLPLATLFSLFSWSDSVFIFQALLSRRTYVLLHDWLGFYKEVADSSDFLNARFSMTYLNSVTRKKLVRHLRDTLFPVHLNHSLYSQGVGQDVLRREKKMCIAPRA